MPLVRIFAYKSEIARNRRDFSKAVELKSADSCENFVKITNEGAPDKEYHFLDYYNEHRDPIGDYDDAYRALGGHVSYDSGHGRYTPPRPDVS